MHNVEVMNQQTKKNPHVGSSVEDWFAEEEARSQGFIAAIDAGSGKLTLARQLKQLREAAGMTQVDLAKKIGTKQPGIARVERGLATPSLEMLFKIGSALGMSVTVVFRPRKSAARKPAKGI